MLLTKRALRDRIKELEADNERQERWLNEYIEHRHLVSEEVSSMRANMHKLETEVQQRRNENERLGVLLGMLIERVGKPTSPAVEIVDGR